MRAREALVGESIRLLGRIGRPVLALAAGRRGRVATAAAAREHAEEATARLLATRRGRRWRWRARAGDARRKGRRSLERQVVVVLIVVDAARLQVGRRELVAALPEGVHRRFREKKVA